MHIPQSIELANEKSKSKADEAKIRRNLGGNRINTSKGETFFCYSLYFINRKRFLRSDNHKAFITKRDMLEHKNSPMKV